MKIRKFESVNSNIDFNIKCSDLILDTFGDNLAISNVDILDDVEYNFRCTINSITDKSYDTFKVLFDLIQKNSTGFIFTGAECFAKIFNVDDFCNDISNVKLN